MPHISYVCMSDLHLGADTSLLTRVAPIVPGQPREDREPADVSEVMHSLAACLESLLGNGEPKPTLILLGDALEFALAFDEDAATAFRRFAELVMSPGRELFDAIWYVPGNHDHHLWEGAREKAYASYVARRKPGEKLEEPWHSTRMLRGRDANPIPSPMLTALAERARHGAKDRRAIDAVYPNLGLVHGDRAIALHHGHLMESPYRLLSTIDQWAFDAPEPRWVWDLEADNFAWIDFFWSSLGRCGDAGRVNYIFGLLQDPEGRRALTDRLSPRIAKALPLVPVPEIERLLDQPESWLVHWLLERIAEGANDLGRRAYYDEDPDVRHEVRALGPTAQHYVGKYVTEQLRRECGGELPKELTFVFGHTHTPFELAGWRPEGSRQAWQVFNTGGWVHESADLQAGIGASLVLIDEELTPVAVRLYSEFEDLPTWVRAEEPSETHTPFFREIEERLARDPGPWQELATRIGAALLEHLERFEHATQA